MSIRHSVTALRGGPRRPGAALQPFPTVRGAPPPGRYNEPMQGAEEPRPQELTGRTMQSGFRLLALPLLLAAAFAGRAFAMPAAHPPVAHPDRTLFELIAAGIAAHRGDTEFASAAWLDAARSQRNPEIAELAWQAAVANRDSSQAEEAARLWLELDPKAERARLTLLAAAVAANDGERIRKEVSGLLANRPADDAQPDDWLARLLDSVNRSAGKGPGLGALADAISPHAQAASERRPDVALGYAQLLAAAGRGALACRLAELAAEKASDAELLGPAADICWPVNAQKTRALVEGFLRKHPNDAFAHLILGRIDLRLGRRDLASESLARAARGTITDPRIAFNAGQLAADLNDAPTTERTLSRYVELLREKSEDIDLSRLEAWLQLGNAALIQKAPERAAKYLSELRSGPFALQARIREALALTDLGRPDEALAELRRGREAQPIDAAPLWSAEIRLLMELDRRDEAIEAIGKAVAAHPFEPDLLYECAMIEEELGRSEDAERHLRALLAASPSHVQGCNALGYLLADAGRSLPEARGLLERAYKAAPLDPYILDSMGWLLYREGRPRSAAEFVLSSLKRLWDKDVAAHLVEILATSGRADEARTTLSEMRRRNESDAADALAKRFSLEDGSAAAPGAAQ